jgi:hypothetical protein
MVMVAKEVYGCYGKSMVAFGVTNSCGKYEKQDQQGKAAFNERNPHMTQQQEPMARSPGGPQT